MLMLFPVSTVEMDNGGTTTSDFSVAVTFIEECVRQKAHGSTLA